MHKFVTRKVFSYKVGNIFSSFEFNFHSKKWKTYLCNGISRFIHKLLVNLVRYIMCLIMSFKEMKAAYKAKFRKTCSEAGNAYQRVMHRKET